MMTLSAVKGDGFRTPPAAISTLVFRADGRHILAEHAAHPGSHMPVEMPHALVGMLFNLIMSAITGIVFVLILRRPAHSIGFLGSELGFVLGLTVGGALLYLLRYLGSIAAVVRR